MRKPLVLLLCLFALPLFAAGDAELFQNARALMVKGQNEKAAQLLEKAIALNPNNADYHYYLGGAYGNLARQASIIKAPSLAKKAKAALEKAVQVDPRHFDAQLGLLTYYLQAPGFLGGGEDKALAQAAAIKKIDALQGHRAYARIYTSQKKFDKARAELVTAVRAYPTNAKAHYYLGNAYANEKNHAAAAHEYDQALKLDASYMPPWFRIGWLAAETNSNHARGEEALRKYLTHNPSDTEPSHASTWYYLGQLYEKQGRKADAKNAYQQGLKLVPDAKDLIEALKRVS